MRDSRCTNKNPLLACLLVSPPTTRNARTHPRPRGEPPRRLRTQRLPTQRSTHVSVTHKNTTIATCARVHVLTTSIKLVVREMCATQAQRWTTASQGGARYRRGSAKKNYAENAQSERNQNARLRVCQHGSDRRSFALRPAIIYQNTNATHVHTRALKSSGSADRETNAERSEPTLPQLIASGIDAHHPSPAGTLPTHETW